MNKWMDAEERAQKAHELYELGRLTEAADELRVAISVNPQNVEWHFNLALTLEAMKDYQGACESYKAVLTLDKDDIEALNCLGVNLTRQGKYAEALQCFERIEKIDWTYEAAYCNRIVTYTDMGDHENAELMFYMARLVTDECPTCSYNIGNSLFDRGLYDRAIQCWRDTLWLDGEYPQANARIADALWAKGDLQGARKYLEAELALNASDSETLVDLGELFLEMGLSDEAEEKFKRALAGDGDNPTAHLGLGELAMKNNDLEAAKKHFRKVLSVDATYPGAHAKLGEVLLRLGYQQSAAREFEREMNLCGDDRASLRRLGQILLDVGQCSRARPVWRRLVELDGHDAQARHNLAVSFFMMDRLDEGIYHCRKALRIKPDYALALYNLALAHLKKGQIARARRYVARAMAISPHDENIKMLSKRMGMRNLLSRIRLRFTQKHRNKKRQDHR